MFWKKEMGGKGRVCVAKHVMIQAAYQQYVG